MGYHFAVRSAVLFALAVPAHATEIHTESLEMAPGAVRIFRNDTTIKDVLVGRSEVADVTTMTDQRFAITAKNKGRTNIVVLDQGGVPTAILDVDVIDVRSSLEGVRREVQVHSFGKGYITHHYVCYEGRRGACEYDKTNETSKESIAQERAGPTDSEHPCNSPDDVAADGSRCGDRASNRHFEEVR